MRSRTPQSRRARHRVPIRRTTERTRGPLPDAAYSVKADDGIRERGPNNSSGADTRSRSRSVYLTIGLPTSFDLLEEIGGLHVPCARSHWEHVDCVDHAHPLPSRYS